VHTFIHISVCSLACPLLIITAAVIRLIPQVVTQLSRSQVIQQP